MVSNSRAPLGSRSLRPLNAPAELAVDATADGHPHAVRRKAWRNWRAVTRVQDRWRIDDEWWRERPISRLYHTLILEDGTLLTVYHDLVTDLWFEQKDSV
jgi:hypothetical protein